MPQWTGDVVNHLVREKRQDLVFCGGAAHFNKAANGQKPETHLSAAGAISTES
jgi:hypothetical protein